MLHAATRPSSLKAQIALVAGFLVIAVSAVLSLVQGEILTARIRNDANASLYAVADNTAQILATGLFQKSLQVEVLSRSAALWRSGLDTSEAHQLITRAHAIAANDAWIGVADLHGVVRSATGGLLQGQSVRARPWFQAGLNGPYVGDVHQAELLSGLLVRSPSSAPLRLLDFAAPIRVDDRTIGVYAVHTNASWIADLADITIPSDAYISGLEVFIFDRDGGLIHAPSGLAAQSREEGLRLPIRPQPGDDFSAGKRKPRVSVVTWPDGHEYLTAVTRMTARSAATDLGWYVVARQSEELAFADTRQALLRALGIGALAALVATLVGWLAARQLGSDLQKLAKAARQVESGQRSATMPVLHSSRETRQLSDSFASMTQRLLELNGHMEEQVRQRTLELEAANRELDHQAHSDPLTGVLNRRGFDARMQGLLPLALRSRRPLALLMVDVDHFKRVNDTWGHHVGDEVLRALASVLRQRMRESDVLARLGGEEFAAALPDTDLDGARRLAQQLVDGMAGRHDTVAGQVTISIGVSVLSEAGGDTLATLLRRADEALYAAKGAGRNRVETQPAEDAQPE